MKIFALRHKTEGWFAGFTVTSNGDEAGFCNDTEVQLDRHIVWGFTEGLWVTTSKEVADKVAITDTPWYNSSVESPRNPYAGWLEVVEFTSGGNHE